MDNRCYPFKRGGYFSDFDLRMAAFLSELSATEDPSFFLAAALVSQATASGDVCLNLSTMAGRPWPEANSPWGVYDCPALDQWCDALRANEAVGSPGQRRPLILDDAARLYFYRFWEYERHISDAIAARVGEPIEGIDTSLLKGGLRRLFPSLERGKIDWQAVACIAAVFHRFAVISGGPGTGKTSTVANILALLLEQPGNNRMRISLCAPTGKAAARLTGSIQAAKKKVNCDSSVRASIPDMAITVHRLLKAIPGSSAFRYHCKNPLPFDLVVVDEASMVDVALMSHLVQALSPSARLILSGDKDQLASVEAGAVLGDICAKNWSIGFSDRFSDQLESLTDTRPDLPEEGKQVGREWGRLADSMVVLRKSYRFEDSGGIGRLARRVNAGDARGVFESLLDPGDPAIRWQEAEPGGASHALLAKHVVNGYREYLSTRDPHLAIERFERFKILCAVKSGPFGVDEINGRARRALAEANLLAPDRMGAGPWYVGRPVLIARNDYELGLFNGDMGITLPDPEGKAPGLFVFFPGSSEKPMRFDPLRLSTHETVFAMTVHKSQGSEFDDVLLVLPNRDTPVLTRELIYTAVTRARRSVTIWGRKAMLEAALSHTIDRTSGLRDRLWGRRKRAQEEAE